MSLDSVGKDSFSGREPPLRVFRPLFRCPACRSALTTCDADSLACERESCAREFPIVSGVPVLIDEATSLFSIDQAANRSTEWSRLSARDRRSLSLPKRMIRAVFHFLKKHQPTLTHDFGSDRAGDRFRNLLFDGSTGVRPRVLLIGSGNVRKGSFLEALLARDDIDILVSDVFIGEATDVVCDGHQLPLVDGCIHGVFIGAVLEHVLEPLRVVDEIHRVLSGQGLVLAITPFMQHEHLAPFDFQRYTIRGHRRLFSSFSLVDQGPVSGPGTMLAWSLFYFWMILFGRSPIVKTLGRYFCHVPKYLDGLERFQENEDAASAFFFLGRRNKTRVSDRTIVWGDTLGSTQ